VLSTSIEQTVLGGFSESEMMEPSKSIIRSKPIMFIPTKDLPTKTLCVGIKTADETIIVHKEGAKR
jgi:hypothetical protein